MYNDLHRIIESKHYNELRSKEKKGYDNLLQYVHILSHISKVAAENLEADADLCEVIANCMGLGAERGKIGKKVIAKELDINQVILDEIAEPKSIEGKIVHFVSNRLEKSPNPSIEDVDKIVRDIIEKSKCNELQNESG